MTDKFLQQQQKLREVAARLAQEPNALAKMGKIIAKWKEGEDK